MAAVLFLSWCIVSYLGRIVYICVAEASTEHHPPEGFQGDATVEQIVPNGKGEEGGRKGVGNKRDE